MPIYRGTSVVSPKNIILGNRQIAKVYLGSGLVWQKNYAETSKYGFLYNRYAVDDERDLAPTGWHIPTLSEYLDLFGILGAESDGGKLKGTATEPDAHPRWNDPNVGALNTFDWDGYGGGYREDNGCFDFHGFKGFWWTSDGYLFGLSNDSASYFYKDTYNEKYGASVRFVKDDDVLGDGTVTDASGNVYNTVKIGSQVWMKENLRTTRFRGIVECNDYIDRVIADGGTIEDEALLQLYFAFILEYDLTLLEIPNVIEDYPWSILTTPAYCIYNYDVPQRVIWHNKLKGLQGGKEDEYFHLTEEQYDELHDRLHDIDSVDDHAPALEVDWGKFIFADPLTGEISLRIPPSTNYQIDIDVDDDYINTGDTKIDVEELREYRIVEDENGTKYLFETTSPKVIHEDSGGVSPKSIKISMI